MKTQFNIESWAKILKYIFNNEGTSVTKIARDLEITYSYVALRISDLEESNIISKHVGKGTRGKKARKHKIFLTTKGEEIAELCCNLLSKIEIYKEKKL